jgi:rare lipoprotein A
VTPTEIASALPAVPAGAVETQTLAPVPGAATAPPAQADALPAPLPAAPVTAMADQQPTGQVSVVQVPVKTRLYVQLGAFSDHRNAERLKARLSAAQGLAISPIDINGQRFYRVRIGPFDDVGDADQALSGALKLGGTDAKIVVDE